MIHHEIKTPLTSIKGCAQLMQRRGAYSEWAVKAIIRETDQLRETIERLLEALQLETEVDPRAEPTDLVELAREATAWARERTAIHVVRLETPDASVIGRWDGDAITCVLQELLVNAINFAPRGGEIRLTVTADEGEALLAVHDAGVGISPEETPRVFERFYRAHRPELHNLQGLGLGLYICSLLITAHSGRIWARSRPGAGSTFFVALPRERPRSPVS